MSKYARGIFAAAGLAAAAVATTAMAQSYLDPQVAYSYVYYADAAKTEYLGETADTGCVVSGRNVYAQRVQVPTPYFDATPMYVCTGIGPWLPGDW